MKNTKVWGWAVLLILSVLYVIYSLVTFQSVGSSTKGMAFDTGQVIGLLLWVIVEIFSGYKIHKSWNKS